MVKLTDNKYCLLIYNNKQYKNKEKNNLSETKSITPPEISFKAHHKITDNLLCDVFSPSELEIMSPWSYEKFKKTISKIQSKDVQELLIQKQTEIEKQEQSRQAIAERKSISDIAQIIIELENNTKPKLSDIKHSVHYQSWKKNPQFIKRINEELHSGNFSPELKDMINQKKYDNLARLIQQHIIKDNKFYNNLYKKLYLDKINITPEEKELCMDICREYNTHVFVSNIKPPKNFLKIVKQELDEWKEKSDDKAFYPYVIQYNAGCCGHNIQAGYISPVQLNTIFLNPMCSGTESTLRHEMIHLNDRYSPNYDESEKTTFDFDKIIPIKYNKKELEQMFIKKYGYYDPSFLQNLSNLLSLPIKKDLSNCQYLSELFKSGIVSPHEIGKKSIPYAYESRSEFIAEAGSGACDNYTQKFKQKLVKMGLPKYVLKMKCFDKKIQKKAEQNNELLSKITELVPDIDNITTSRFINALTEIMESEKQKTATKMMRK